MLPRLKNRLIDFLSSLPDPIIHRIIFLVFILIFASNPTEAQKEHKRLTSNLLAEGQVYYGFLIPHHLEMEIFNAHFPAFEVALAKKTFGKARWEYMYNYPLVGVAYWYSNLGSSPYLGDAHAVFPYINFSLNNGKKVHLFLRVGLGVGYLTKKFHRLDNYKNIAIGSNFNAAVNFLFQVRQRLGKRFELSLSLAFTHFSNGSMKSPNYGLNIPSVSAGLAYRLAKENPYFKQKLLPELIPFYFDGKKSVDLDVSAALGYKDMLAEIGGRSMVYAAHANLMKPISFKTKYGACFDLSYDGTDGQLIELAEGEDYLQSKAQLIQVGLGGVFELSLSQISFVGTLGLYVYTKYKGEGNIYQKIAMKYQFHPHWFTAITLKAHAGRADYISIGMGYKFNLIYY